MDTETGDWPPEKQLFIRFSEIPFSQAQHILGPALAKRLRNYALQHEGSFFIFENRVYEYDYKRIPCKMRLRFFDDYSCVLQCEVPSEYNRDDVEEIFGAYLQYLEILPQAGSA